MRVLKLLVPALFLFTVYAVNVNAQNYSNKKGDVYLTVEEMPKYPGGDKALRVDIANAVKYPKEAVKKGISGKVYVTFVVNEQGKTIDSKIARGVDPLLDKEALRVMNELKTWTPGKEKGKPVKVAYTVPINFALDSNKNAETEKTASRKKNGDVYFTVEEMPEFPGGDSALRKYIAATVKYPEAAKKNRIQGKVYVTFVVGVDGSVSDATIARGVDPSLDKESLRVVKGLPKWKSGMEKGQPVKVQYTVPIKFALDDSNGKKS